MDPVERILSSSYLRCRQTVEPLAERLGLDIVDDERLVEGTPFGEALALIIEPGEDAVMCTQGDIVEGLVEHLLSQRLIKPAETGGSKASTWVLQVEAGRITSATYMPPPA